MLEKICTNLEISKKLKSLKLKIKKPCFFWFERSDRSGVCEYHNPNDVDHKEDVDGLVPAYTLEQILELLPNPIIIEGVEYDLHIDKEEGENVHPMARRQATVYYQGAGQEGDDSDFYLSNSESNLKYVNYYNNIASRAALLAIKLKEDKII
jgi:hypothetical protein